MKELRLFIPLLDYLATVNHAVNEVWHDWHVQRITGGWNNLLYRATNAAHDLAIKFTIRDERDRAGREYDALHVLDALGSNIAPKPVWLERERYAQPVVVQTWLQGGVSAQPPQTDGEWQCLLQHYTTIHGVTPERVSTPLRSCVLDMRSAQDGVRRIRQQAALIPADGQPHELQSLIRSVEQHAWPTWPEPRLTFCRTDPNPSNLIRRAGAWASVDWENSGWGDPAFEIADLLVHPAFLDVPVARCEWFMDAYGARFARSLHEVPRGGDQRLVERPANWSAEGRAKYESYQQLALKALA